MVGAAGAAGGGAGCAVTGEKVASKNSAEARAVTLGGRLMEKKGRTGSRKAMTERRREREKGRRREGERVLLGVKKGPDFPGRGVGNEGRVGDPALLFIAARR